MVANDLLMVLGLPDYMDFSDKCNLTTSPYVDVEAGQVNGKSIHENHKNKCLVSAVLFLY